MLEKDETIYKKKQGLRIRLARRMTNMTQQQLAEKLNAELGDWGDDVKVSRIERGQDVTSRELAVLSVLLGQPIPWLMGVEDEGMNAPIIHELSEWFRRPIEAYAARPRLKVA